jgi:type II pantothenate kinase
LADPQNYVACPWDLIADERGRDYWLGHFATHSKTTLALVRERYGSEVDGRIEKFKAEFRQLLDRMRDDPAGFGELTILTLDEYREEMLVRYGFHDPFADVKRREDDAAVPLFPRVVEELAGHEGPELIEMLIRGVFAGNIFDLGSLATIEVYNRDGLDFFATRESRTHRPWLYDDLDALTARLLRGDPYHEVLFFIDNTGADLVLGCLPLARQLALWGTKVVLAANSRPSLNDVTIPELKRVVAEVCGLDKTFADLVKNGVVTMVPSGGGAPLIDLSRVSDECNEAARDADLVILEGMGRSVESNFEAAFDCDCLKLALLKDQAVAERIRGKLFDAVCRFEAVAGAGSLKKD